MTIRAYKIVVALAFFAGACGVIWMGQQPSLPPVHIVKVPK